MDNNETPQEKPIPEAARKAAEAVGCYVRRGEQPILFYKGEPWHRYEIVAPDGMRLDGDDDNPEHYVSCWDVPDVISQAKGLRAEPCGCPDCVAERIKAR